MLKVSVHDKFNLVKENIKGFSEIIIILIIVILIGVVSFLVYQNNKSKIEAEPYSPMVDKTSIPTTSITNEFRSADLENVVKDNDPFILGNFTFNPDPSYIKRTRQHISYSPYTITENPVSIITSTPDECGRPGNQFSVYAERNLDTPVGNIPSIILYSFDTSNVTFSSVEARNKFFSNLESMQINLENYSDFNNLYRELFDSVDDELYFGFTQKINCGYGGGGWTYPLLVEKIDNNIFDQVYYVEVNSGNGDLEQLPNRQLFVRKENSWLFISASQEFNSDIDWTECYSQEYNSQTTRDKLKCVENITRLSRDNSMNQEWIKKMLSFISYNS